MRIIVPTKGRRNNQLTVRNLTRELRPHVTIVCPSGEVFWLRQDFPEVEVISQPRDTMNISEKRAWIMKDTIHEKIVMLDDDLRFAVRRTDDPGLFRKAEDKDINQAFKELEFALTPETPHAGFSARGSGIGDAAKRGGWQEGKRMMYVLGYHVPTVNDNVEHGRLSTHEDMDVCLQLLSKGFPNLVNFSFVVDQKFGNPGGCTTERTIAQNNADVLKLAEFFPDYVRATVKTYANSPDRVECVCQWARCLQDGVRDRKLREQTV